MQVCVWLKSFEFLRRCGAVVVDLVHVDVLRGVPGHPWRDGMAQRQLALKVEVEAVHEHAFVL